MVRRDLAFRLRRRLPRALLRFPFVCAGPAQLASAEGGSDPAFDPVPSGTTSSLTGVVRAPSAPALDALREVSGDPLGALRVGLDGAAGSLLVKGPGVMWAVPDGAGEVLAAGSVTSLTKAGDLRGLAGTSCAPGASEQWLVGGSTALGSSTRLVLTNPSGTPARAEIEVWGPAGRIELEGPGSFAVPARGQVATLLEGLASQQRRLAIRVVSSGALIAAHLQVNYLDGLTPGGVDFVAPTTAPTRRQILTGLTVQTTKVGDDDGAVVRLLAPGTRAANVTVTVFGAKGRVLLPGAERLVVPAGELTALSLAGLEAGTYAVLLESDTPVTSGAMLTRHAGPVGGAAGATVPRDVAFLPATPLDGDAETRAGLAKATVAFPAGVQTRLSLLAMPANVADVPAALVGEAAVEPIDPDGEVAPVPEVIEAQVVLLTRVGHIAGTYPVRLTPGITTVVNPGALAPGADIAGAYVLAPAAATGAAQPAITWSATLYAGEVADGLISVLAPVPAQLTASEMAIRPSLSTGLGTAN